MANLIKTQFGKAQVEKEYCFEVDCLQVGCKELDVFIKVQNTLVSCECHPCGMDRYKITFVPTMNDVYEVSVYVGGIEISGSPFLVDSSDSKKVEATGEGLKEAICGKETLFQVNTEAAPNKKMEVIIIGPNRKNVQVDIDQITPYLFIVSYRPTEEGIHIIEIFYDSSSIKGSPFSVLARRGKIFVKNLHQFGFKNVDHTFEIDASEIKDPGLIEIDSSCPIKEYKKLNNNHVFSVTYRPFSTGVVDFVIKYDNREIKGSPFHVYIEEK